MERRKFIKNTLGFSMTFQYARNLFMTEEFQPGLSKKDSLIIGPRNPVFIYNNWSAYDELSDNIPQTEDLAMKELNELIRLKKNGVQVDYYVMDAFWFDKYGGYRTWHRQHWPN